MDIERLRALEKKFQDEATVARDTFKYGGGEYYDGRRDAFNLAADELATLIAELGQEVGAVEVPHPLGERHAAIEKALKGHTLLLMSRDHVNDQKKPLAEIKFGMSTDLGVLFCLADTEATMPVDTSPAHTSEARDAVVAELIAAAEDHMNAEPMSWQSADAFKRLTKAIAAMRQEMK